MFPHSSYLFLFVVKLIELTIAMMLKLVKITQVYLTPFHENVHSTQKDCKYKIAICFDHFFICIDLTCSYHIFRVNNCVDNELIRLNQFEPLLRVEPIFLKYVLCCKKKYSLNSNKIALPHLLDCKNISTIHKLQNFFTKRQVYLNNLTRCCC